MFYEQFEQTVTTVVDYVRVQVTHLHRFILAVASVCESKHFEQMSADLEDFFGR